jgi:hypothetical protein
MKGLIEVLKNLDNAFTRFFREKKGLVVFQIFCILSAPCLLV